MNVGLIGFGKTGRLVAEEILRDRDLSLVFVLRRSSEYSGAYASRVLGHRDNRGKILSIQDVDAEHLFDKYPIDVLIDFSSKSAIHHVYMTAATRGIKIVSAISNYDQEQFLDLKRLGRQTSVLHSPNITLGINFLMGVAKSLQKLMPTADIEIIEEHFREKKDVSGTALRIARNLGLDEANHVNSIRVGGIVGKHEIIFGLQNQTLRLVHESINRASFGEGAIYAAKWLMTRKPGLYSMEDVLGFNETLTTSQASPSSLVRSHAP